MEEFLTDPPIRECGLLQDLQHPQAGRMAVLGSPWRLNNEHPSLDSPSPGPCQRNALLYGRLPGLAEDEMQTLREQGVS